MDQLAHEISSLEHRNLKTIDTVTKEQEADVESTREVYLATNRKSLVPPSETLKQAGDRSGLPSLVNIALCTSEQVRVLKYVHVDFTNSTTLQLLLRLTITGNQSDGQSIRMM